MAAVNTFNWGARASMALILIKCGLVNGLLVVQKSVQKSTHVLSVGGNGTFIAINGFGFVGRDGAGSRTL